MTSDQAQRPRHPSGTGGLPQPACRCCHDLGWIDTHNLDWTTPDTCTEPAAHARQPRHELAGGTAYECPHCIDPDPTLELPTPTAQRTATVLGLARRIVAPIYRNGVHHAALRALRAEFAIDDAMSKEQPDA